MAIFESNNLPNFSKSHSGYMAVRVPFAPCSISTNETNNSSVMTCKFLPKNTNPNQNIQNVITNEAAMSSTGSLTRKERKRGRGGRRRGRWGTPRSCSVESRQKRRLKREERERDVPVSEDFVAPLGNFLRPNKDMSEPQTPN